MLGMAGFIQSWGSLQVLITIFQDPNVKEGLPTTHNPRLAHKQNAMHAKVDEVESTYVNWVYQYIPLPVS